MGKSKKPGFYLLEIVLVLGIMATLGAIGFIRLDEFRQNALLETTTEEIVASLRTAQGKTLAGEADRRFQVHFTSSQFQLLDELGNVIETTQVADSVSLTPPAEDIVFEKVDGASNGGAVGLALTDGSSSRTITVSPEGVVSVSTP